MRSIRESLKKINAALGGINSGNDRFRSLIGKIADSVESGSGGSGGGGGVAVVYVVVDVDDPESSVLKLSQTSGVIAGYLNSGTPVFVFNTNPENSIYVDRITELHIDEGTYRFYTYEGAEYDGTVDEYPATSEVG